MSFIGSGGPGTCSPQYGGACSLQIARVSYQVQDAANKKTLNVTSWLLLPPGCICMVCGSCCGDPIDKGWDASVVTRRGTPGLRRCSPGLCTPQATLTENPWTLGMATLEHRLASSLWGKDFPRATVCLGPLPLPLLNFLLYSSMGSLVYLKDKNEWREITWHSCHHYGRGESEVTRQASVRDKMHIKTGGEGQGREEGQKEGGGLFIAGPLSVAHKGLDVL